MLARKMSVFAVLVFGMGWVVPAQADWLAEFGRSVCRDVKRRNCWPEPFVCPDRQDARAPFGTMVQRGWERQNLLADPYFEENSPQLTEAGRLKVRWILTEAPSQHRVIYVRRGGTAQETAARLEAVHAYVAQLAPGEQPPPIIDTNATLYGWPSERIDVIGRKFNAAPPEIRVPKAESNGGGDQK